MEGRSAMYTEDERQAAEEMEQVYPVKCDCGWFGDRMDCKRGECPNCGDRVTKDTYNHDIKRIKMLGGLTDIFKGRNDS
jgi:hypothetical protein